MNNAPTVAARACDWIARMPFCGEYEVARALGNDEHAVRPMLQDLKRRGFLDSVEPGSPDLERRRRYFITEDAVAVWTAALEMPSAVLAASLPVRRNDLLKRVACIEVTTGVGGLCADLADGLRRGGTPRLVDARSLPLGGRAAERWWLHGVDGYGCLEHERDYAPFFVVWDRFAAPDAHRRQRADFWHREARTVRRRWGKPGLPPILLVCPTTREADFWLGALADRADDGASPPLGVFVTTRRKLRDHGAGGPVWRSADGEEGELVRLIGWGAEPSVPQPPTLPDVTVDLAVGRRRTHGALGRWAARLAVAPVARARWQHASALALATRPGEQTLVDWIARHPLLAASDLAEFLGEQESLIEKRLERLVRLRVVRAVPLQQPTTGRSGNGMAHDHDVRYLLTEAGMQFLASRAGVVPSTFGEHASVTYVTEAHTEDPVRAVRHVEHTLGLNRFVVQLARDTRARAWHLAEWRNEAESACRFRDATGGEAWIRPDGSVEVDTGEERLPFLIEYDRGTLDRGDYRSKLEGYRRYYTSEVWRMGFEREPVMLFVCVDDRAERRVIEAVAAAGQFCTILAAAEWRFGQASAGLTGALGRVWYTPGADGQRRGLVDPKTDSGDTGSSGGIPVELESEVPVESPISARGWGTPGAPR